MTYAVRGWMKESNQFKILLISEQEYEGALAAKRQLLNLVAMEDAFDQFIENYLDYEADVLGLAQRQLLQSIRSWSAGQLETQRLNRRVGNMLTSARLYQELVSRITKKLQIAEGTVFDCWKLQLSAQYDRLLGHRAMELLRNYTQHYASPISKVTARRSWTDGKEQNLCKVVPFIGVSELERTAKSSNSGRRTLQELAAIGKLVPLTPLVREYVEGLGLAHEALRLLLEDQCNQSVERYNSVREFFNARHQTTVAVVQIVALNEDDVPVDEHDIFEDLTLHHQGLTKKNQVFVSFGVRHATGDCSLYEQS